MALFTIAEPGQSKTRAPARRKRAAGIDLGTTNSLVATAREGKAQVLRDAQGEALLPSIVTYSATQAPHVGVPLALDNAQASSISSVKRLMGRGRADIDYPLPYLLEDAPGGGMPLIHTVAGKLSPVQVSADILRHLAARGGAALGGELDGVVITVPAYFDEAQRQATRDAARLAGLTVLRLLSEPTAAAVAYGLDQQLEGTVIIYDLGGGTFDVSLMQLQQGVFRVLATGGDAALGGDDFDRAIALWLLQAAGIAQTPALQEWRALLAVARTAKHGLTTAAQVPVAYAAWQGVLTRETYYSLVDGLIDTTLRACKRVLRDAQVQAGELSNVVLVGGATRSPRVQEKVAAFFGRAPLCSIDPEEVVAIGAALQADVLAGNKYGAQTLLLDVIPLSLGIETMGGLMEKIIARNSAIPVARSQEFTTYKDGQTSMSLHVLQGERELVQDCRSLARFDLTGIPPLVAGAARVKVTFQVDADGLLEVSAAETTSGHHATVLVKPSFGLQENDIADMLKNAYTAAEADKRLRKLREKQVEALRHVEALQSALAQDGAALLSAEEITELTQLLQELRALAATEAADAIESLTQRLNEKSLDFAARRMDAGIHKALAGRRLNDVDL
ncbi:MAG: Fe-S protein assembly chaperone HscA [Pseudomonadales bacterium]|jgi:molecular chaperone HscA|nr:Fe-S protein assembly chaperone HscA [Pseudomonadales bacterium]